MSKKILSLLVASVFLLISCSKDDDANQNQNFHVDFSNVTIGSVVVEVLGLTPGDQVFSSGLVWGTNDTPDITTENYIIKPVVSGSFQDTVYGLLKNTSYNFRAFQQTESGVNYGSVFSMKTSETCNGQAFQGDVILRSQKEVDDFDVSNICSINGSFQLISENLLDPIIDISKFSQLTSVGTLQIYNNRELGNIVGLQNIETVSEFIFIGDNRKLVTIDPLSSVSGSVESVSIRKNEKLINLNGLNGLTTIGVSADGGLDIYNNLNLESLASFDALEHLSNFSLNLNPSIISVEFPNLTGSIKNFNISENGRLASIISLGEVNEIENFIIFDCGVFENIGDLNSLTKINYIDISDSKLINLDFLSSVNEGEDAYFGRNYELSDFCGLQEAILKGSFKNFYTSSNAFDPTRKDLLNGNCSL